MKTSVYFYKKSVKYFDREVFLKVFKLNNRVTKTSENSIFFKFE